MRTTRVTDRAGARAAPAAGAGTAESGNEAASREKPTFLVAPSPRHERGHSRRVELSLLPRRGGSQGASRRHPRRASALRDKQRPKRDGPGHRFPCDAALPRRVALRARSDSQGGGTRDVWSSSEAALTSGLPRVLQSREGRCAALTHASSPGFGRWCSEATSPIAGWRREPPSS